MDEELFWRYTFYGSLIVLSIWTVLKVIGVIQTPAIVEFGIPAAGLIVGVLALYKGLLMMFHKMDVRFSVFEAKMGIRVGNVENKMENLDAKMGGLGLRLGRVEQGIHGLKKAVANH